MILEVNKDKMINYKKILGNKGESETIEYLKKKGFSILTTNFTYHKYGEIDIIGQKNDLLIFVEVKYRTKSLTTIYQTVSKAKQKKIIRTVEYFLMQEKLSLNEFIIRFDVAFINENILTYIENAFTKE
jgi:putative endonuclease